MRELMVSLALTASGEMLHTSNTLEEPESESCRTYIARGRSGGVHKLRDSEMRGSREGRRGVNLDHPPTLVSPPLSPE